MGEAATNTATNTAKAYNFPQTGEPTQFLSPQKHYDFFSPLKHSNMRTNNMRTHIHTDRNTQVNMQANMQANMNVTNIPSGFNISNINTANINTSNNIKTSNNKTNNNNNYINMNSHNMLSTRSARNDHTKKVGNMLELGRTANYNRNSTAKTTNGKTIANNRGRNTYSGTSCVA